MNKLLGFLAKGERDRLAPHLERIALGFEDVLYEPEEPIRHVYFPTSGIIALLLVLEGGRATEVARVGGEGMIGLPIFFGLKTSRTRALVQIPGEAVRMKAPVFRREARRAGPLFDALLRYGQALMCQVSQVAACNSLHTLQQRLYRWLLTTQDRVQADEFELTQEFLSQMLGARRESITVVAGDLQRRGLIRYSRGTLRILDRSGLEAASCECYRAIRRILSPLPAS